MKIDTKELINKITPDSNIEMFFEQYSDEIREVTIKELLDSYLFKKEIRIADVAEKSGHGEYVYKVFNGSRIASRDILIAIAIGLSLELEECQLLLRVAKYAVLDPRDKKDSICIFAVKSKYTIERLNDLLYENGFNEI